MTPEEYRLPATKKPFREYLEGLPEGVRVNPGAIFGCFFCGFVRQQLGLPSVEGRQVQFHWDYYQLNHSKHRRLPEWAQQFTWRAHERAVVDAALSINIGRLTPKAALEVLAKC